MRGMLCCGLYINPGCMLQAPKAAENFLALCASGYYDGTLFHRNIKGFMIQVTSRVQAYQLRYMFSLRTTANCDYSHACMPCYVSVRLRFRNVYCMHGRCTFYACAGSETGRLPHRVVIPQGLAKAAKAYFLLLMANFLMKSRTH